MKTKVIKVGGSLLTDAGKISHIKNILDEEGTQFVLVLSAFRNVTNLLEKWYDEKEIEPLLELVKIHRNIFSELFPGKNFAVDFPYFDEIKNLHLRDLSREAALALGEKMSTKMIEMYLGEQGVSISSSVNDPLVFGNKDIFSFEKSSSEIKKFFESQKGTHIITQGFASWYDGNASNLGREGSDLTAALWAKSLDAECILYKDVGALYTKDPHKNSDAEKISEITFTEYREKFFGAGVVHDKVIDFCIKEGQAISLYSFSENTLGTKFL